MEKKDYFLQEIERLTTSILRLLKLNTPENKEEFILEITNTYTELFDLNGNEITLHNKIIQDILHSNELGKLFIKKLETLIKLIEIDYNIYNSINKKEVLYALLNKLISVEKTYSIDLVNKLSLYK